ncbi:MAG: ABC transporter permease [Peptococcaceae bacterium]|nr:ABC transporter permease [Peptococcaceae bacterium]
MEQPAFFKRFLKKSGNFAFSSLSILLFILVWEIAGRTGLINAKFLPPFSTVVVSLWELAKSGVLLAHIKISLERALVGYILGVAFAVPLGIAIGTFRRLEQFLNPLLQLFRNMSVLALLPVFVLFFGIGEVSKVGVIFWGVLWNVLLNTVSGVKNVDQVIIKGARAIGTSRIRLFATVILPGALPHIFSGMRISATTSIVILIAAEMLGASKGLGYALYFYQANMMIPRMYSVIIIMAVLGVVLNFILEAIERHNFRWRDNIDV